MCARVLLCPVQVAIPRGRETRLGKLGQYSNLRSIAAMRDCCPGRARARLSGENRAPCERSVSESDGDHRETTKHMPRARNEKRKWRGPELGQSAFRLSLDVSRKISDFGSPFLRRPGPCPGYIAKWLSYREPGGLRAPSDPYRTSLPGASASRRRCVPIQGYFVVRPCSRCRGTEPETVGHSTHRSRGHRLDEKPGDRSGGNKFRGRVSYTTATRPGITILPQEVSNVATRCLWVASKGTSSIDGVISVHNNCIIRSVNRFTDPSP